MFLGLLHDPVDRGLRKPNSSALGTRTPARALSRSIIRWTFMTIQLVVAWAPRVPIVARNVLLLLRLDCCVRSVDRIRCRQPCRRFYRLHRGFGPTLAMR